MMDGGGQMQSIGRLEILESTQLSGDFKHLFVNQQPTCFGQAEKIIVFLQNLPLSLAQWQRPTFQTGQVGEAQLYTACFIFR